eukprot:289134_1
MVYHYVMKNTVLILKYFQLFQIVQYAGGAWVNILSTLFLTLNSDEIVMKYGPTYSFSTDCEQLFEPVTKQIRELHGIVLVGFKELVDGYIYDKTLCGNVTEDKDSKHIAKKFRISLID